MSNLGPQIVKDSYQNLVQITSSNSLQKGDGTDIIDIVFTNVTASNVDITGKLEQGLNVVASGFASHAQGGASQALGTFSHAEGNTTTANGNGSHAEGAGTIANGISSHAEGDSTIANGLSSHTEGLGTIADGDYQLTIGQYNTPSSAQSAFIIGNGVDGGNRSNLLFAQGSQVQITGSLRVNGSITGSLFGTASWAQNALTASVLSNINPNVFVQGGNSFGTTAVLGTNDNQNLQFETSGSVRMTINSSGNVGIGTTNPLSTLTVAGGNININTGYGIGGNNVGSFSPFIRYNTNAGIVSSSFGHETAYMLSDGGGIFGTNDLSFYAGAVTQPEIMRIVGSTGFVGIGESSPSAKLEIKGSGTTSATTALRVENSAATARLTILDNGTSAFNTSHLYISSSGNVGIGTTTPGVELDVVGSIRASSTMFNTTTQTNNIQTNGQNLTIRGTAGTAALTMDQTTRDFGIGTTTPTARLHISGASNSGLFEIDSPAQNNIIYVSGSGNVGIGTGTPTNTLQVAGTSSLRNIIFDTHNTYDIGTSAVRLRNLWANGSLIGVSGFINNQTIYNSASIGPGDFTPTARLHISGSDSIQMMRISSPTNTNILFVSGSGNVGIGTSTPLSKLHISASSDNEFLRITSGSQNILNVRSGSVVFFAGTGVAPSSGFDLDIQGTGTANNGSVRIAGNSTVYSLSSNGSINRTGTGNQEMFGVVMGGSSTTQTKQNPLRVEFNANQGGTAGYAVLRLNATHTTVGSGPKLLQTWEFAGVERSVVNITGSIGVGITTPSASIHISSSLGLPPMLALTPHHPLPTTGVPTGSFMVSSSVPPKPFFWDGSLWNALY